MPDYTLIRPSDLAPPDALLLAASSVVPRPIFIITSVGAGGVVNAAPFSSFTALSADPFLILCAIHRHPDGSLKDTARNVLRSGQYVLNAVTEEMAGAVTAAGERLPPEASEVQRVGWNLLPARMVRPPRIAQSPLHLECELCEHRIISDGAVDLLVGRVLALHARDDILSGNRPDPARLKPLGHLDPGRYAAAGRILDHRGMGHSDDLRFATPPSSG